MYVIVLCLMMCNSLTRDFYRAPQLVETPRLAQLQLVYNVEGLIICRLCEMGVKMDQIYAHVTTNKLVHSYAKCDDHGRACPKNITSLITEELKNLLRVEDLPILQKPLEKRHPIKGLKVLQGFFICEWDGCSSGYSTMPSVRAHRSEAHTAATNKPKRGVYRTGHCQTLYLNPATYFEVDNPIPSSTSSSTSEPTFDLNTFLHERKTQILHNQHPKHQPVDPRIIPPAFVELGFYTFITSLDQSFITGYMEHKRDGLFSQLRKLVVQSFKEDCDKLEYAHKSIREAIMENPPQYVCLSKSVPIINPQFNSNPQSTTHSHLSFNPPLLSTTKVAYAVAETEMICILMMYHQSQLQNLARDGGEANTEEPDLSPHMPFHFSETQCVALETLYNLLITKGGKSGPKKAALYGVFYSLYMEDQPLSKALQSFASPVAAYFALRCWDNLNGTFINVRDIPVALAKLQYSIRLRCSHKILHSAKGDKMAQMWIK
jgi:hypothetical protein